MSKISLGRYVPYNSFIHKIDPRAKLFCIISIMVAIFIPLSNWATTFIVGGALAIIIFAFLLISHVSIRDIFKSLRVVWFFVILITLLNVLIPPKGAIDIAFSIGDLNIYWDAIFQSLKIILRLVLMVELTLILTSTTRPLDLTYALEWYMTPLKIVKFPAHIVAMVISIALRFIPTLLDETERIMKAQESRGVDFKHGKFSTKIKAIVSLIIPLFVMSFQKSEDLADSMEARGYDPKGKRTRYRVLKFKIKDLFSSLFSACLLAGVIVISCLGVTFF